MTGADNDCNKAVKIPDTQPNITYIPNINEPFYKTTTSSKGKPCPIKLHSLSAKLQHHKLLHSIKPSDNISKIRPHKPFLWFGKILHFVTEENDSATCIEQNSREKAKPGENARNANRSRVHGDDNASDKSAVHEFQRNEDKPEKCAVTHFITKLCKVCSWIIFSVFVKSVR